jgi:hypothetical protein
MFVEVPDVDAGISLFFYRAMVPNVGISLFFSVVAVPDVDAGICMM